MLRRASRLAPKAARRRVGPLVRRLLGRELAPNDETHPERLAVLRHIRPGRVLEVGCGPRKSAPHFIGADLTPGGMKGAVGNAAGRLSQADVAADGTALPFGSGLFGTLVARHNLEHYIDLVAVLSEWSRVLEPGGRLIAVVPDEAAYPGRTVELDPTHYHSFDASFCRHLLEALGWQVHRVEPCIEKWSLLVVASSSRP